MNTQAQSSDSFDLLISPESAARRGRDLGSSRPCARSAGPELRSRSLAPGRGGFREELFRRARRDAEALAAATPYPGLFLPLLIDEKTAEAERYARRQERIWDRTQPIVSLVA